MLWNTLEFRMAIPAVTREYTPGSCRNSRKPMRCPPHCEMRPDSPALGAEKFPVSNETHRSLDVAEQSKVFNVYPRRNSRTYPSFPLQLEKNHQTSCSLKDVARFPCIACRAIPCSQSNR